MQINTDKFEIVYDDGLDKLFDQGSDGMFISHRVYQDSLRNLYHYFEVEWDPVMRLEQVKFLFSAAKLDVSLFKN